MKPTTADPYDCFFFFSDVSAKAFDVKEIVPGGEVAAEIGSKLVLNCSTTGCESPTFSWRTQLDYPLGGIVSNQGSRSVLTMDPVSFANEHDYLCSASCGGNNRQRTVSIRIFCKLLVVLFCAILIHNSPKQSLLDLLDKMLTFEKIQNFKFKYSFSVSLLLFLGGGSNCS